MWNWSEQICVRVGWIRSSSPEVFSRKGVLKICIKFTGEHPCRSVISIKLQSNVTEITLWHGCSPVNLLHILRTPFDKNTSGELPLLNEGPGQTEAQAGPTSKMESFEIIVDGFHTSIIVAKRSILDVWEDPC